MTDCGVCIGGYDGERCEVWVEEWRTARKEHKCCECARPILKGERYHVVSYVFESEPDRCKTCAECAEIREVFSCGDGYMLENLWEDMADYVFERLTTANNCFQKLTPAAKKFLLVRWQLWKGIQ